MKKSVLVQAKEITSDKEFVFQVTENTRPHANLIVIDRYDIWLDIWLTNILVDPKNYQFINLMAV
jgi:hypothetical protein